MGLWGDPTPKTAEPYYSVEVQPNGSWKVDFIYGSEVEYVKSDASATPDLGEIDAELAIEIHRAGRAKQLAVEASVRRYTIAG